MRFVYKATVVADPITIAILLDVCNNALHLLLGFLCIIFVLHENLIDALMLSLFTIS